MQFTENVVWMLHIHFITFFLEFCAFCDVEYREAIKHCSTRWLSLSKAVQRILSLYPALRSYFLSTGIYIKIKVIS